MVVNISIKEATPEPSTMKLRLLWPSTTLPTSDLGNTYVVDKEGSELMINQHLSLDY